MRRSKLDTNAFTNKAHLGDKLLSCHWTVEYHVLPSIAFVFRADGHTVDIVFFANCELRPLCTQEFLFCSSSLQSTRSYRDALTMWHLLEPFRRLLYRSGCWSQSMFISIHTMRWNKTHYIHTSEYNCKICELFNRKLLPSGNAYNMKLSIVLLQFTQPNAVTCSLRYNAFDSNNDSS